MLYIKENNVLIQMMNYEDIWNWYLSKSSDDFDKYENLNWTMISYVDANYPEQIEKLADYEDLDNHFPFLTEDDYKELCNEQCNTLEWLDSRYDREAYLFENQLTLF